MFGKVDYHRSTFMYLLTYLPTSVLIHSALPVWSSNIKTLRLLMKKLNQYCSTAEKSLLCNKLDKQSMHICFLSAVVHVPSPKTVIQLTSIQAIIFLPGKNAVLPSHTYSCYNSCEIIWLHQNHGLLLNIACNMITKNRCTTLLFCKLPQI